MRQWSPVSPLHRDWLCFILFIWFSSIFFFDFRAKMIACNPSNQLCTVLSGDESRCYSDFDSLHWKRNKNASLQTYQESSPNGAILDLPFSSSPSGNQFIAMATAVRADIFLFFVGFRRRYAPHLRWLPFCSFSPPFVCSGDKGELSSSQRSFSGRSAPAKPHW